MAQQKKLSSTASEIRAHGEGDAVPIVINELMQIGTQVRANANVDLNFAQAPSRKFIADCFEVRDEFTQCRLIFGQRKVDGVSLRAILDIRYPFEPLPGLIAAIQETAKVAPEPSGEFLKVFTEEPEQAIGVEANFARINGGSSSANIDFYYASAIALSKMVAEKKIYVDGVVRLVIPLALIGALAKELNEKFPTYSRSK